MTAVTNLAGADSYVLQEAISALTDEEYSSAKKLVGTGIVGDDPQIDSNSETFIGQIRWWKPLQAKVNVQSLTDSTSGQLTDTSQAFLKYIKTARSHGARQVNVQQIITQTDGLQKIARDVVETRTGDESNAMIAVLKAVAISEALNGASDASGANGLGGQTFENDPTDMKYGFYVDLGASKIVVDGSASVQGAQRAEGFLQALGKGFKDYEPDYAYLITSPEVMASLRSANLVDADKVTEGNIDFNTIFQGKLRLIQTRSSQGFTATELTNINAGPGVNIVGTKTSFIVLPGALKFRNLNMPLPFEVQRTAGAFQGAGTTDMWYRWGFIVHPAGYNWVGYEDRFPSNAAYMQIEKSDNVAADLSTVVNPVGYHGLFQRKFTSALTLGILPVFHS